MNIPDYRQNLGDTLAFYGIPMGPYIVLPFLGGSFLRDSPNLVLQAPLFLPVNKVTRYGLSAIDILRIRHSLIPLTTEVDKLYLDKYSAVKSIIHQNKKQSQK